MRGAGDGLLPRLRAPDVRGASLLQLRALRGRLFVPVALVDPGLVHLDGGPAADDGFK